MIAPRLSPSPRLFSMLSKKPSRWRTWKQVLNIWSMLGDLMYKILKITLRSEFWRWRPVLNREVYTVRRGSRRLSKKPINCYKLSKEYVISSNNIFS